MDNAFQTTRAAKRNKKKNTHFLTKRVERKIRVASPENKRGFAETRHSQSTSKN